MTQGAWWPASPGGRAALPLAPLPARKELLLGELDTSTSNLERPSSQLEMLVSNPKPGTSF